MTGGLFLRFGFFVLVRLRRPALAWAGLSWTGLSWTGVWLTLLLAGTPANAASESLQTDHLRSRLVAKTTVAVPGQTMHLGLLLEHDPHWHTYWKNPGDSGLVTTVQWLLPEGLSGSEIRWPVPERFEIGGLANFGYGGRRLLPLEVQIPATFSAPELSLMLEATWLICEVECIPGSARYLLSLPLAAARASQIETGAEIDPRWAADFAEAEARKPLLQIGLAQLSAPESGPWTLAIPAGLLPDDADQGLLFPATAELVEYTPPRWQKTAQGWHLSLARNASFSVLPAQAEWWWVRDGRARVFVSQNAALAGADAAHSAVLEMPASAGQKESETSFALALVLALLGGLILNLMPCVFPVLSLKAMSTLQAPDPRSLRRHSVFYLAGVLLTFLLVAITLLGLRHLGAQIGWGFQMQSPQFVAAMALLLTAMALSFSGLWEFGAGFSGAGQSLAEKRGGVGAFFTGVLAVVVASPCTAPFMGTALGAAIQMPTIMALMVFLSLGFGLALPMVLLGFVPALARHLPKPGAWMQRLRELLSFPLYLTVVWLLWVYGEQTSALAMAWLLAALIGLAFGLWLWMQRRQVRAVRTQQMLMVLALICVFSALSSPFFISATPAAYTTEKQGTEAFSETRLAELRASGQPVLVNMTAAWCITCLANERLVLRDAQVQAAMRDRGVAYLKGDWTLHDPAITAWLAKFGRNGVPLYVWYPAGGDAQVLPQVLTVDTMLETFASSSPVSSQP